MSVLLCVDLVRDSGSHDQISLTLVCFDPCEGALPAVEGRPRSSVHTLIVYLFQARTSMRFFSLYYHYNLDIKLVCRGGGG